jgi:hypothetical protein
MTTKVANLIDARINELGKRQLDIAAEAGFNKPNIITMIKQGKTRLPLDKVGPMARSLELDPVQLLHLWFDEYEPETWDAIREQLDNLLTAREMAILAAVRSGSAIACDGVLSPCQQEALARFIDSLSPGSDLAKT